MNRSARHLARDSRGQSLVEFALVLPMLLVVMLMITEFGRALWTYNVLAQATREGARIAVVSPGASAVADGEAAMTTFLTAANMVSAPVPTVNCAVDVVDGNTVVRATASRPFVWVFAGPMPANADGSATVGPRGLTINAQTVMRAETF
ncbi:MAG: TadE/TadG family type IV pilus assembly protein [Candidatus Eiseniibacteriota bacterium]